MYIYFRLIQVEVRARIFEQLNSFRPPDTVIFISLVGQTAGYSTSNALRDITDTIQGYVKF